MSNDTHGRCTIYFRDITSIIIIIIIAKYRIYPLLQVSYFTKSIWINLLSLFRISTGDRFSVMISVSSNNGGIVINVIHTG